MPPKIPASLVRHLQGGRCVLFAGAGLSAQARLPSWGKLLSDMVQTVGAEDPDEESAAELAKLLQAGRYLDVADECKERLGAGYAEILSRTLQVGAGPVPEAHRLVMELPFSAWITTNYDKLLEQAHFQVRGAVPKTLTHLDADTFGTLLFDGAPFILKAHGDIDKPESLIFTTRDYREIIHANPAFNAVFSAILLTRAVLFVGYSLNDPDFRLLLDRQLTTFKKFVPERYAIMSGVGEVEREVLRRTAQIKVIPYPAGQHEELVAFLRTLQEQVAPRPQGAPMAGPVPTPGGGGAPPPPRSSVPPAPAAVAAAPPPPPQPAPSPPARPAPPAPPTKKRSENRLPIGGVVRATAPVDDEGGGEVGEEAKQAERAAGDALTQLMELELGVAGPLGGDEAQQDPALSAPTGAIVLTLRARGSRIEATLRDPRGDVIAHGSGQPAKMPSVSGGDASAYRRTGTALASHLPGSVMAALAGANASEVILDLDAELESRPWELLEVRGTPLALRFPVTRAPVGLSSAARGRPMLRQPVRALIIGDPMGNEPGARQEAEEVANVYRSALSGQPLVLVGSSATAAAVISALTNLKPAVIHHAGHAWYDALDAYLAMAGGERLTEDALRPCLSLHPPAVLMLNSHCTAFVPAGGKPQSDGKEAMRITPMGRIGFTDTAMRSGVGAFIGSFGSPAERPARELAVRFHQNLLTGFTAAQALFKARTESEESSLLYALSGYGDLALE